MSQPLLNAGDSEAEYMPGDHREQVEQLNNKLRVALSDIYKLNQENARLTKSIHALRGQLAPLYRACQFIFGEIDASGVTASPVSYAESEASAPAVSDRIKKVWDDWKSRLGAATGKVIEALLLHGEMSNGQLVVATGLHRDTITKAVYKLNKASLINKNGKLFSLKKV